MDVGIGGPGHLFSVLYLVAVVLDFASASAPPVHSRPWLRRVDIYSPHALPQTITCSCSAEQQRNGKTKDAVRCIASSNSTRRSGRVDGQRSANTDVICKWLRRLLPVSNAQEPCSSLDAKQLASASSARPAGARARFQTSTSPPPHLIERQRSCSRPGREPCCAQSGTVCLRKIECSSPASSNGSTTLRGRPTNVPHPILQQ